MAKYYVNENAQPVSGDHEVHVEGCVWLNQVINKKYLGEYISCHGAVEKAKEYYPKTADGCATCCPACHRS